jgi:hypothetical protein
VCIIDHSSLKVVVIAGRSCSEISPDVETNCQRSRNAAIEAAVTSRGRADAVSVSARGRLPSARVPGDAMPGADAIR